MIFTDQLMLGILAFVSITDVMLYLSKEKTYSSRVKTLSKHTSFAAFSWGVIGGHFFGPFPDWISTWWVTLLLLAGAALILELITLALGRCRWSALLVDLPIGVVSGMLLWPQ